MHKIVFVCSAFLLLLAAVAAPAARAAQVNNTPYAELLAKYNEDGLVNYTGLKEQHAKLKKYLDYLASINPDELARNDAFAYYINLYNAATLDIVLDNYPGIESIKDIGGILGSPWKKDFIRLNGKSVSLDYIEHGILRPVYMDPRVHFAVNCASMGCPPLHGEPFEGATLDFTLDELTRNVMADPSQTRLEDEELFVNKVFDWFGGDWGSKQEKIGFVRQYAPKKLAAKIGKLGRQLNLEYSDWDWTLNDSKLK